VNDALGLGVDHFKQDFDGCRKRPGTPEVALLAAFQSKKLPNTPNKMPQKMESMLKTEKSITPAIGLFCRWVRWWPMYSPALGAFAADIL